MSAKSALSSFLTRLLNGKEPGGPFGPKTLDVALGDRLNEVPKFQTGTVTVANGATTGTVSDIVGDDGAPVFVSPAEDPTAATWWRGSLSGGTLTVTIDQDNTADLDLFYFVDGR